MNLPVSARLKLPDGREFDVHTYVDQEYVDGHKWWWQEGNGGCDCNRSLYLNRQYALELGVKENDDDDVPCLPCGDTITLVSLTINGNEVTI